MDKSVKKGLEFGVGMTYLAMDALDKSLKQLEKSGKISRKASEKLVMDTIREYQKEGQKYARQAQGQINAFMKANPATKKDIANLQSQIKQINKLLKKYSK